MRARVVARLATISALSLVFLTGPSREASAALIELENDVGVELSDACQVPILCPGGVQRPPEELLLVIGAPRLVPDARSVGDLLQIDVDFLGVSLNPQGSLTGPTPLFLNVFDADANKVLQAGDQLRLTYWFAPTDLGVPVSNVVLNLADFQGFDLLPPGDLIFTVSFRPKMSLLSFPNRPAHVAIITVSGPGNVVPEPGTVVLLLSGLTTFGLSARWQRARRQRS